MANKKALEIPQGLNQAQINLIKNKTPQEYIKQREGRGGKVFNYVEISYVISQLNQIFGFKWNFEVVDSTREGDHIVVLGKLTVKGAEGIKITKTQYGGADVKKRKEDKEIIDLADDYKAASSDCLKKCASQIGIALDVYSGETKKIRKGDIKEKTPERKAAEERAVEQAKELASDEDKDTIRRLLKELKVKTLYKGKIPILEALETISKKDAGIIIKQAENKLQKQKKKEEEEGVFADKEKREDKDKDFFKRKAKLARLHILKKEMIDKGYWKGDEDYRNWLKAEFNKETSKDFVLEKFEQAIGKIKEKLFIRKEGMNDEDNSIAKPFKGEEKGE